MQKSYPEIIEICSKTEEQIILQIFRENQENFEKITGSRIFEPGKFPGFLSRFVPGWTL